MSVKSYGIKKLNVILKRMALWDWMATLSYAVILYVGIIME